MKLKYLHFHYFLLLFLFTAFVSTNAIGQCIFLNSAENPGNTFYPRTTPQTITINPGNFLSFEVKNNAGYIWDVCGYYSATNIDAHLSGFASTNTATANWSSQDYCSLDPSSLDLGVNGWISPFSGAEYVQINELTCPPANSIIAPATLHYYCVPPTSPIIGNPGNGVWNIYCFDAGDASGNNAWNTNYSGFYTDSVLNFNTASRWTNTPYNADATKGSAYSGCYILPANQSWRAVRTNIPCGIYQIQATYSGTGQLLINNNPATIGGTYIIGPSDKIEFRVSNAGEASGSITFNSQATTPLDGGTISYNGTVQNCVSSFDPPTIATTTSASGGTSDALYNGSIKYQWQRNNVNILTATLATYDPPSLPVGTYTFRRKAIDKCGDSAFSNPIIIHVDTNISITQFDTICEDALPYTWNGITISTTGGFSMFYQTHSLVTGCDSITTLNLLVNPLLSATLFDTICADELPYSWNGISITTPGTSATNYTTPSLVTGCDSTTTLNLTVHPLLLVTESISICPDQLPYIWNGQTIAAGGTAVATYTIPSLVTGCDSTTTLNLTVWQKPVMDFIINTANQCINPNSYTFTNNTTGAASYSWDFGDGTAISTATSPSGHAYTLPGTYHVKLIATSSNSCKDSITKDVTVYPKPTVDFNINIANQCINPNSYTFTNMSSGAVDYEWSFGDSHTSTDVSPTGYSYTTAGSYGVKVIAISGDGCKDSMTKSVTVYAKPVADFSITTAGQCVNANSFTFATTPNGATSYDWDFGDGTTATGATPAAKTYTTANTYNVKLVVTNGNSCKDSITKQVTVNPKPVAGFNINAPNQCMNTNNYTFPNTSTGATSYQWSLGDGNYTTVDTPINYGYGAPGTFHVTLIAITNNGCKDSITQDVTVYPVTAANFSINAANQCVNPNSYTFTSTSGSGVSYDWDFGDGTHATGVNPATKVYTAANTYDVKLVVTSINGCKDSITKQVTVYPKPTPDFDITAVTQCSNANSYTFTNRSGGGATYQWYFGDGGSSTATSSAGYIYANSGTYHVRLIVTSVNNCIDSITKDVTVYGKPPVSFTGTTPDQCANSNSYTFVNTSGGGATYQWSFGDGGTFNGTNPGAKTYAASGVYEVKLIATDANNCKDSVIHNVTINPKPNINFSANAANQCINANSYNFSNNSSISNNTPLTYEWDFGDGSAKSTATNPSGHIYAAAGTYDVKLIATSNTGCKDSLTIQVTVHPKPTAAFSITNANQCVNPNSYTFINTSTTGANYLWDYGDGTTASGMTPVAKVYVNANTYDVKLIVTDNNGCKDSTTNNITVYPKPNPSFTVNAVQQCLQGNSYVFTNISNIAGSGTMTYEWRFGDGGTYTGTTPPAHVYAASGGYFVTLIATSNFGCKDSVTQEVTVSPKPIPSFTINQPGQCLVNNSYTFINTSTIANGPMTYTWDFGDGATYSGTPAPAHNYTLPGIYHVKLIASSSAGCKDSIIQDITVYPKPAPSFTMSAANICLSPTYTFTNTSTIGGSGTMTYEWTFGDGGTYTGQTPPAYTYAAAGTYTIKLIATSNFGCKDSASQSVTIYPKPVPSFSINQAGQCLDGNSYTFTNASTNATSSIWYFGDGNTYAGANPPAHNYTTAAIFAVKLVVTGSNGCKDSVTQNVTVYPEPVPAFTMNAPNICVSPTYTFTNTSAIASGSMTYNWSFGDGDTYTGATPPPHTYATPGTYTVKLDVTSNNGCKKSTTQTVTILAAPIASFTVNAEEQCVNDNNYVFTNTSVVGGGLVTYLWNFGDGTTSTIDAPTHVYTTAGPYTITLIATNSMGCSDTASAQIKVYTAPTGTMTGDNTICLGQSTTISIALTGTPPWELSYSDGNNVQTATNITTSPYIISVTPTSQQAYTITNLFDAYCAAGANDIHGGASISVAQKPSVSIDRTDSVLCQGDELQLVAHGTDSAYRWSTGAETCCINIGEAQTYRVTVSNQCGDASDSITIAYGNCEKCIWVPSGFTPNGDGKNDVFRGISYCKVRTYSIKVFNRFGNVVYESTSPKEGWDGTTNGQPNPIDTYFYIVKATFFVSGVEKDVKIKGDVTLIR